MPVKQQYLLGTIIFLVVGFLICLQSENTIYASGMLFGAILYFITYLTIPENYFI